MSSASLVSSVTEEKENWKVSSYQTSRYTFYYYCVCLISPLLVAYIKTHKTMEMVIDKYAAYTLKI